VTVLVAVGDLVEDVVVVLGGPVNAASDTSARISRRRGGSAANVAVAAAGQGGSARFVGQVGVDAVAETLVADLAARGVDVAFVRRAGRTATIVVLVDETGERTMLVDRGSARDLDGADGAWLDGASVLHLTLYSLLDEPIASTSRMLAVMAAEREIPVSVDVSSVALIAEAGPAAVIELVASLHPAVVFANADEAAALGLSASGVPERLPAIVIVKRGADPSSVHLRDGTVVDVPSLPLDRPVDTTAAGDTFAAGFLTHDGWRHDPVAACAAGHRAAHALLTARLGDR